MIVGFLILGTVGAAWRYERDRPLVVWSATLALLILPVQVILGGLTVTELLQPVIVTAHLGTAILILIALTIATVTSRSQDRHNVS
jgi:cytochrome c oxidase assembly protein subunit 15